MKRLTIVFSVAVMTILIMSDGCKKDDDKVLNKITVSGNETTEYNVDYIPASGSYSAPVQADCQTTLYYSNIWIEFESGGSLQVSFYHPTLTTTIPTGTFQASNYCETGFIGHLYPVPAGKFAGLLINGGTLTVSKSGDTYNVDIDATIDADYGSGTVKGNFTGILDQPN